jgi:carboxymethylenebutenolidase
LPSLPAPSAASHAPLEPEPVQKWAEEGYAVVGATGLQTSEVASALKTALKGLADSKDVDIKDKVGLVGACMR